MPVQCFSVLFRPGRIKRLVSGDHSENTVIGFHDGAEVGTNRIIQQTCDRTVCPAVITDQIACAGHDAIPVNVNFIVRGPQRGLPVRQLIAERVSCVIRYAAPPHQHRGTLLSQRLPIRAQYLYFIHQNLNLAGFRGREIIPSCACRS
ncbi:Uncharacterised protein [Escherichia coli]|nr:Uncharacterised protein [Escherichia coli]VVY77285.1 Uncharacterised protein [Escherichia coli]